MTNDLLGMDLTITIVILLFCILIENSFPQIFQNNSDYKKVKISIDLSDWRHCIFLFTVIMMILFTPGLNLAISTIYSLFIIYQVYRYYRK